MPRYKRKSVQQSKKDLKRKNDARDFESETVSKKAAYKLSSDFLEVFKIPEGFKIPIVHQQQRTGSESKSASTSEQQYTTSDKQPSTSPQQSTSSVKRPSIWEQPSTNSKKRPSSSQQSSTSSNKPPSSFQQSSTSSNKPPSSSQQSSTSSVNQASPFDSSVDQSSKSRANYFAMYKRLQRKSKHMKAKEKQKNQTERETKTRQDKRLDPLYKEGETERETKIRKEKRLDKTYKKIETLRDSKDRKDKRLNPFYKKCETGRETKTRRGKRSDPLIKKCETERETKTRRDKRSDPLYKEGETERETKTRQDKRLDPLYKEGETERETKIRKEKRLDKTYKKIETLRDSKDRKDKRLNPFYKICETGRETKTRRDKRSDPLIKKCETERETKTCQDKRLDPLYKEGETERETKIRKEKRLDPLYKEGETERETKIRKEKRLDPLYKEGETERETKIRKEKRLDKTYKKIETLRDSKDRRETKTRRGKRLDPLYKEGETERETTCRKQRRLSVSSNITNVIEKFHSTVNNGPIYVCTSCQQLWYKHSVRKFKSVFPSADVDVIQNYPQTASVDDTVWICSTCQSHLKKGKIPPSSTMNKMTFPEQGILKKMNHLELSYVSVLLPFMKIHQEPRGKQKFIHGNMVLVPANISSTVTNLPRMTSETATIKATLKRRLKYQHHVYCLNVRPELVHQAAEFLKTTPLYKAHNVTINSEWTYSGNVDISSEEMTETDHEQVDIEDGNTNNNDVADGALQDNDGTNKASEPSKVNEQDGNNESYDSDEDDKWSEVDENELMSGQADTLLTAPDFVEPAERQLIYNFAPGEGQIPVCVLMEENAEELAFPGIFCGTKRPSNKDRSINVSYGEIVKAELRNVDRRAAGSIENIFFKTKKIQMKTLLDQTQLALRKVNLKDKKLTVKDVRGTAAIDLIHHDKAYKFLTKIRGSPPYFEQVSKELFALIRQIGPATFFLTLSAAETRWLHLLRILGKVVDKKDYTDNELNNLSWQEKCRLIQSEPITCARHFDFCVQKFITEFLLTQAQPLGDIKDYFYRIEYQQRGSPHVHMMVWCSDAPKFCEDSDDDVCAYIDRFITCRLPDESESELFDLVSLQSHKHTKTCRKKGKKTCRFGFPKPPLKKTTILHPLEPPNFSKDEIARHKSVWISIKKELDNIGDDENTTICLLLDKLELTYEKYILAIRASIKSSTVFLKRSPQEVRVNNYNTNILKGWRANLDVQFVLHVFACATYVASYITKSQRGMSELLRKASDEARKGNQTLTEQIKTVGNHFLNAVEIGAQEAAYICLQLPMKKSSRQTIFLNTSPPEERVSLLKPSTLLDKMEDEDDDIECGNIFSRYCDRPRTMENMTLTEYAAYYDDSPGRLEFRRNTKGSKTKTVLPEPNIEKNDDEVENEEIDVSKDSRQYRKRKKARIIRSVHFDIKTDSEKYYRELLVLYSSWRNENDLKKSCNSFNERYLEIKDEVETERELYEPFREIVEDAQQIINQGVEDSWDEIAPQTEMQNAMDKDNRTDPKDTGIENYDIGIDLGLQPSNQEQELNRDFELPDQEFRCHLRKLNKEQLEFVYDAIHILKTSEEPIYWFLSGGAGVGKSYVTKALYQMAVKFYSKQAGEDFSSNKVMLLAPTGKAAYHIHGNTIHSALKVPVNQKLQYKQLSSAALNTLRNQIGEVNLIFIDEISMVGFNMLNFIHQRLMEVTQKNELFGGISVIAVGDLFQLKPVMDSYLFTSPTTGYMPLATNIWKENFTMFELHEIMRQSENKPFAELLNRLREGKHNKQDISVLKERNINENTEDYPWDVPHLFCTNEKVDSFNSAIIHRKNDLVYVIRAHDKFIGSAPPGLKAKILDSFGNNKQNSKQLLNSLEVAENTYYEITANLDTTDGLINGASCKMMKVEINQISEYASGILWVQFEDQNIGKQHRRENRRLYKSCHLKEWTPLEPVSKSFAAGNKGEAQIQRSQFPIRPAHAKTVHRSQGDTLSKVVVDLTSKRRVDHIHYVAVSRVQTLDGLFIRNLQEDKIGVDKNVKTEMERLRATTIERRLRNIYDLENSLLKICFLNASSLHRHLEDVRLDRNITNADIACFCETRFHNRDSVDATQIDAFHQYRQDSKPSGHKRPPYGLAIYSKEPFCPSFPINESSNGIELSVFRTNHNSDITIVTVYKPPHKPISELCERLLHVHETYVCNNDAIILGDLNVNWKEDSSNKQKLLTLMQQLKYKQLITQPTNDYGSTIDLIFTNIDCVDSGTNEVFFSDHKLTWLSLLSA